MSDEFDPVDDQSNDILSRLRGISSEEKTELGKLKCRIDDQSRLIMMLKKRNDEYLLQNIQLDKHCQNLEKEIDHLKDDIHQQSNKTDLISELYSTIEQLKSSNQHFIDKEQQNYQQIRFYESQLKENQIENENLRQEILSINRLLIENQTKNEQILDEIRQDMKRKIEEIEEKRKEIRRNEFQIIDIKKNFQNEIQQLKSNESHFQQQMEIYRAEIEQFRQDRLQIDKTVQISKDNEKTLEKKLGEKDEIINQLKNRFNIEEENVNRDVRVKYLEEKISIKDEQIHQIQQEFNAYRIYTTSLLDKEKQINERFRNLLSGKSN